MRTIQSQIAGEFNGTNDEAVYKLVNGQVWQQVGYSYRYTYRYRPRVAIVCNGSRCEMHVDGFAKTIRVRKIA